MSEAELETLKQQASNDLDGVEYLRCLAVGKPFEAEYTLFGGLVVTFRELSLQDLALIEEAERTKDINRRQAEVFASISKIENKAQEKSHIFKSVSELAKTNQNVIQNLIKWFHENVIVTVSVYTAIERAYDDFKARIDKIIKHAADPDFFVETSRQGP